MNIDFDKIQQSLLKVTDDEYIKEELDKNLSPLEQTKINTTLIISALKLYHQELEKVVLQCEK